MNRFEPSFNTKMLLKFLKNFKSIFGFGVLLILLLGLFSAFVVSKDEAKIVSQNHKKSFDYLPTSTTNQIVKHD